MYCSGPTPRIYQEDPLDFKKQSFKLKSWTETVVGYMNEADKLSRCLMRNREVMNENYTWAVSINIEMEMLPMDIKSLWAKVCRRLKAAGVVALWVREPSLKNHCNYHLVVRSRHSQTCLEKLIVDAMPDERAGIPFHKQVKAIRSQYHWCRYITKAKTRGMVDGRLVEDKYKDKRLLFTAKLDLKKYGTIGRFWVKSKKACWEDIKKVEERISKGLEQPKIKLLARYAYDLVQGWFPLRNLERQYGYAADDADIQQWADEVVAMGYEPEDAVPWRRRGGNSR